MKNLLAPSVFMLALVFACSSNPYKDTNKAYRKLAKTLIKPLVEVPQVSEIGKGFEYPIGTINFNLRKPNYVIIHHTAQNACEQTLKTFTLSKTQVSAHYVICKDGTVHHMLNNYLRAWHGGVAKWGSLTDVNSASIGIELDNNGRETFAEPQLNSLLILLGKLKKDYNIPTANFIGHSDIAPSRKQDPSVFFPWKSLAERGFGNWQDSILDSVPVGFNSIQALRLIGYDTKDSVSAIKAFKLHFIQNDVSPLLKDEDKRVLNNLVRKYN